MVEWWSWAMTWFMNLMSLPMSSSSSRDSVVSSSWLGSVGCVFGGGRVEGPASVAADRRFGYSESRSGDPST